MNVNRCLFALFVLWQSLGPYFPSDLIYLIVDRLRRLLPQLYHRQYDAILIIDGAIQSWIQWPELTHEISHRLVCLSRHLENVRQIGVYEGQIFYIRQSDDRLIN